MEWVFFALAAPFWWAISNLLDKFTLTKLSRGVPDFIFFGTIGNALFFAALVAVRGIERVPLLLMVYGISAGFLINGAYVLYAKALDRADASRVAPLFQTIPIFVLIIGYVFLGEALSRVELAGFLLVLSGGFILSFNRGALNRFKHIRAAALSIFVAFASRVDAGFWYMLGASAFVGVSTIFTNYVLEQTSFWTTVTYDSFGFSLAALSLLVYPPWRKEIFAGLETATPKKYFWFFLNDIVDLLGHLFYKLALFAAPAAALVSMMLGVSPFYLLVLGFLATIIAPSFVREDISRRALAHKMFGICVIFSGIYLIFLA